MLWKTGVIKLAKEKTYKIVYDREACIGAAACAAVAPALWEIKDDGKAVLKGGKKDKDGKEVLVVKAGEWDDKMKQSAEVCPVHAIEIFEDDKKVV